MYNRSRIKYNSVNCLMQISFFLIMSSRCPICDRTFSRHTSYSQHVQVYLKNAKEFGEVNTQNIDNEEHTLQKFRINSQR